MPWKIGDKVHVKTKKGNELLGEVESIDDNHCLLYFAKDSTYLRMVETMAHPYTVNRNWIIFS